MSWLHVGQVLSFQGSLQQQTPLMSYEPQFVRIVCILTLDAMLLC